MNEGMNVEESLLHVDVIKVSKRCENFWETYIFEKRSLCVCCVELSNMPMCNQVSVGQFMYLPNMSR